MNSGVILAAQIRDSIISGKISAEEYIVSILRRIDDENQTLNCFISVCEDYALNTARKIDYKILNRYSPGRLAGVPIAVKDNICVKDLPLTCASEILDGYISPYHATVIEKLLSEDAIIVGKTNLDEFGMGSSNEHSRFGPVKNPINSDRVPGGSSGGSACCVAADLVPIALGTDTGGSVRQPAAFCGVYGLRPTYGSVSRYGLVEFASSFDQIGPLAKSVEDIELIYDIISGVDDRDATSVNCADNKVDTDCLQIGLPSEYYSSDLSADIKDTIDQMMNYLKSTGHKIKEISLPHTNYAIACYYILTDAEASSNLARYDGVRYGHRIETKANLKTTYKATRQEGFGEEVKRRIMLGAHVLSHGHYEAWYLKAREVQGLIRDDFSRAFENVDVILTPTTPSTAFKLGEKIDDPLDMYLADIFTVGASLAGLPALSVPCGKDRNNLPIGLQLIAPRLSEKLLFDTARLMESSRENEGD